MGSYTATFPCLTKKDIRNWIDEAYFQRGQSYYAGGVIYEQRLEGMKIKSKCSGSQAPFYPQEVLFNSKGIESAECSCPVSALEYLGDEGVRMLLRKDKWDALAIQRVASRSREHTQHREDQLNHMVNYAEMDQSRRIVLNILAIQRFLGPLLDRNDGHIESTRIDGDMTIVIMML